MSLQALNDFEDNPSRRRLSPIAFVRSSVTVVHVGSVRNPDRTMDEFHHVLSPTLHGRYPANVSPDDPDLWIPPFGSTAKRRPAMKSVTSFRTAVVDPVTRREKLAESKLESDIRDVALADRRIVSVEDQPGRIFYVDEYGLERKHWLDFRFTMADASTTGVLVKPAADVDRRGLPDLARRLNDQCMQMADRFVIMSERNVPRSRVANARLILRSRRCRNDAAVATLGQIVNGLNGAVSIRALTKVVDLHPGTAFLAIVALIDDGRIAPRGMDLVGFETLVQRAPCRRDGVAQRSPSKS